MKDFCCGSDYARNLRASFLLWYIPMGLALLGFIFSTLRVCLWTLAFAWAGLGCVLNARSCGRVHCTFTGPLYLLVAALGIVSSFGLWTVSWKVLWSFAILGTLISFIPEWMGKRYWQL